MAKKLILASASPRRSEILSTAGYSYTVVPSSAEEVMCGKSGGELAELNAIEKAREVFSRCGGDIAVVGADTVVCLNGRILGKPKDRKDAFSMLKALSGSRHEVITGYAVISQDGTDSGYCTTTVRFCELSDSEINAYIATDEPMDKAGAYGIQERACLFAEEFSGDFFNIIGLPVAKLCPLLKKHGILPDWQKEDC
jgi:septum formation protein